MREAERARAGLAGLAPESSKSRAVPLAKGKVPQFISGALRWQQRAQAKGAQTLDCAGGGKERSAAIERPVIGFLRFAHGSSSAGPGRALRQHNNSSCVVTHEALRWLLRHGSAAVERGGSSRHGSASVERGGRARRRCDATAVGDGGAGADNDLLFYGIR
jgi:hypothetical protein